MDGVRYATYLNMLGGHVTIYSFDDKLKKIISITQQTNGTVTSEVMSLELAHNVLKEKLANALVNISKAIEELIEVKPSGNGGKDVQGHD